MIGDAGCARSFAGIASLATAAALFATGALADSGSGTCPAVWAEYVELVRSEVCDRDIVVPVVFEARDGTIYNCLGLDLAPGVFTEMQRFVRLMHYFPGVDIEAPLDLDRSDAWPANVCSLLRYSSDFRFVTVALPSEGRVLLSDICVVRVSKALTRNESIILGDDR